MLAAAGEVTVVKLGGSFVQRYDSTATYVVELLNVNKFDNILNGLLNAKAEKMLLNTAVQNTSLIGVMFLVLVIQGDPNQNFRFQMTVALNLCIPGPIMAKP